MLKEIVVISGKGGTGKTSIVAALASLLENKVLADCDVDAADLHLVLNPSILEKHEFWSGKCAYIDQIKCIKCGKCQELCRFDAIKEGGHTSLSGKTLKSEECPQLSKREHTETKQLTVDKIACEGCGVCAYFCPTGAISLEDNLSGQWFVSDTDYGPLVHAKLGIAEENSGKLVTLVRSKAKTIAAREKSDYILIDGSPGIGCPVIASITGANLVFVITEPTLSGLHDLNRVISLAQYFNTPTAVGINKADINQKMTNKILNYCQENKIPVLAVIPYDNSITQAQIQGKSIIEFAPESSIVEIFREMKDKLCELI